LVELEELLGEVLAESSVIDLNLGLIGSLVGLDISLSLPKEAKGEESQKETIGLDQTCLCQDLRDEEMKTLQ